MVRGWWRPFVSLGAVGLAVAAALPFLGPSAREPLLVILVMVFSTVPFALLFVLQARSRVDRSLRGLSDGGERIAILSDEMSWLAERRVHARSARGEWRIVATGGRSAHLDVCAPGTHASARVWGSAKMAGAEAANALSVGAAWRPIAAPSWLARRIQVTPAYRPRLAIALAAGSFGSAVALGAVLPHAPVWSFLVGFASALGWFVCVVGAWTYALPVGRTVAPLAGVGAGVAFVGLSFAVAFRAAGVIALAPIVACAAGIAALGLAWTLRNASGAWGRAATMLGMLVAAAGALFLPTFYAGLTLLVALLAGAAVWSSPTRAVVARQ